MTLRTIREGARFTFERVSQRGAWMRVTRSVNGVRVTGWMRRADLDAADGPEGFGGFCRGDHGPGLSGRGWGGKPPRTVYKGPARLRAGAKLSFGGTPWATVVEDGGFEVEVFDRDGRRFAEVTQIPGVRVPAWHAKIDVQDLDLAP